MLQNFETRQKNWNEQKKVEISTKKAEKEKKTEAERS